MVGLARDDRTAGIPEQRTILTPDQRPRVFISSTLAEMAPERLAARRGVESLRLIPVMFELGARPHPARSLYRAYLAQSHVFVGLYAERYGWVAPGESVSGLEDEYLLSGELPRLIYLRRRAPDRESRLEDLLNRIREDDRVSYKTFDSPDELERLIRDDLAIMLAEHFIADGGDPAGSVRPDAALAVYPGRGTSNPRHTVPQPLTPLVGRRDEVAQAARLLADGARIVTLVGPGGIGKTRVALEVARVMAARAANAGEADAAAADGVAFVGLDVIRDPGAVLPAIGTSLGISSDGTVAPLDALGRALRDEPLLLVLDNLEQVLECAADLAALLERCPRLRMLATSRAALRVRGEHQVPIGPLPLPHGEHADVERFDAVRLFVDRAREAGAVIRLSDADESAAVAELAERLEGIPLALELAAARTRLLPPRALLDRVRSALDLGSGAIDVPQRQRTLTDTVAWSVELLPEEQRLLLGDLAVFEAPWAIADAEGVAGAGVGDAMEAVAGLLEHSLVVSSAGGTAEPRFRLYDVVRAFARQRVSETERSESEDRYVARMATVCDTLDRGIRSAAHARWRAEYRSSWPDIRSAFEIALSREQSEHIGGLSRSWVGAWLDGRTFEIADLVDRALKLADRDLPDDHRGVLLSATGMAFNMGDYERATGLVARLRDEPSESDEPEWPGAFELYLGYLLAGEGEVVAAERHLRRSVELLEHCGSEGAGWIEAFTHNGLGSLCALKGDIPETIQEFSRSDELGRRYGNVAAEMQAAMLLAATRMQIGDVDEAAALLTRAAAIVETYPFYEGNAYCVEVAASVALSRGHPVAAAEALGAAGALRGVLGARVWPLLSIIVDMVEQGTRAALSAGEFEAAVARGREVDLMKLADVVRGLVTD